MGAPSKRARKVRTASEFRPDRLRSALELPTDGRISLTSWSLADIFAARDDQLLGSFRRPARMAESMRTDDALYVAYTNRLAPQRCLEVEIVPAKGTGAGKIASEAEALFGQDGVGLHPDSINDIEGCLVNHGVAFGACTVTPRDDGTRIDFELKAWPIEFVRWDSLRQCFMTRVHPDSVRERDDAYGFEVPIVHGDGRWVIFRQHEVDPWKQDAAILSAAVVWARHAYAIRDWSKGSVAHGSAKVVGEMPAGVALQNQDGITPEAAAFLELLRSIGSDDSPVGIRPAGSKTDFMTNSSTAWQVWNELVLNAEKAAARIYLGTDGTLGSQGGAPGVDIGALFGVATTKVKGDLGAIERAIHTGVIEPWCAMNFGDSSLAPKRLYKVPDEDADALKESLAKRSAAFYADLKGAREAGIPLTQEFVDGLAEDYGVRAPQLPEPPPESTEQPAADVAPLRIVNEAAE